MTFETAHPLQPFWNLAAAPIQARALDLALSYKLFDQLSPPRTAGDVAQALRLDASATATWLDLLWSMGLLTRHAPALPIAEASFGITELAAAYFREHSTTACAQAWQYRAGMLERVAGQMETLLRAGAPPSAAPGERSKGTWAQAARVQIGQEQRAVSVPAVLRQVLALSGLPERGRLLDAGGGPGHVAIALMHALPGWRGTVCDEPDTARVAQENIGQAGLSDRLDAWACDLNRDEIGAGYDLIWCSSVLHFIEDPRALLQRMCAALNPGGRLLLAHAELPDDPALAAQVMPFYTPVRLRGNHLPRAGEIPASMVLAGLQQVQALGRLAFPLGPVWVYAGSKPE
ncbi:methyltransferase [Pseudomonadota bacterium AL_CKDN230030165-1A_HGKHYDSX7]